MIHYLHGDATYPTTSPAIITHICNNRGGWGKGFVLAISKRWKQPEQAYRDLHSRPLGHTQLVQVEPNIHVANLIAQSGFLSPQNPSPLNYHALAYCLKSLDTHAKQLQADIHAPRLGTGLAGGDWNQIEQMLLSLKSEVYIYDYH
jgi:O-acetyl-ADP-ribose deacetylase (regulator of RNase III)